MRVGATRAGRRQIFVFSVEVATGLLDIHLRWILGSYGTVMYLGSKLLPVSRRPFLPALSMRHNPVGAW